MTDDDDVVPALPPDFWARFEAALRGALASLTPSASPTSRGSVVASSAVAPAGPLKPLTPRERAMLAILYLAERQGLTVKRARALLAREWQHGQRGQHGREGSLPSEPAVSRNRDRLAPLLHAALSSEATGTAAIGNGTGTAAIGEGPEPASPGADDAPAALRSAIGAWSYPAFCSRLRREHGLLWDPLHLQRALNARHPKALSGAILATVLRHVAPDVVPPALASPETHPSADAKRPLTPTAAARRFKDALAYEKRLPGEPGAFALDLWRLTAGLPAGVDLLAGRVRAWVRDSAADDPLSVEREADALLADAWAEVTRARPLYRPDAHLPAREPHAPSWAGLSAAQRCVVATMAAVPRREWSADDLAIIAADDDEDRAGRQAVEPAGSGLPQEPDLDLAALVAGGWLIAVPGTARQARYVCPPPARRHVAAQPDARLLAVAGLTRLWRSILLPHLQEECATRRQPYKTLTAVFEESVGVALVVDCLDAAEDVLADVTGTDAMAGVEAVARTAALLRWMWRPLADLLGPSGHPALHVRLNRVADAALSRLPGDRYATGLEGEQWASLPAEHALMLVENAFFAWEIKDAQAGRASITRVSGPLPALTGGLLPPLDAILACTGAERECLLTAYLSVVEYGILLDYDAIHDLLRTTPIPAHEVAETVERLATLRGHLAALWRDEDADERRKGLDPAHRWNYPSLARWDAGRATATFHTWTTYSLLGEARGARVSDPQAAAALFQQAREHAARTTALHAQSAARNGKWDRVVNDLLLQGAIEREAGDRAAAAVWAIRAATQALTGALEGVTQHLALTCQLEIAAALFRLLGPEAPPPAPEASPATRTTASPLGPDLIRTLACELEAYNKARLSHVASAVGPWAHDAEVSGEMRGGRVPATACGAIVRAWGDAFAGAVRRIARAQPPQRRREILASLREVMPARDAAMAEAQHRHRKGKGGRS